MSISYEILFKLCSRQNQLRYNTIKYSACDWEMKCCSSRCVGLLADYPGDNSTSAVFFYTETFLLRPGMFKDTRLIIQAISKKHLRQPTGGLHRLAFVHLDTLNLLGKEEHGGVDTPVNISWHTGLTLSWLLPYCHQPVQIDDKGFHSTTSSIELHVHRCLCIRCWWQRVEHHCSLGNAFTALLYIVFC